MMSGRLDVKSACNGRDAGLQNGYFTRGVLDPETNQLRGDLIGKPAAYLLERARIARPGVVKLIVVPVEREGIVDGPWGREKLAPIVSLFTVSGHEEGRALCRRVLENMGAGHTAIIHTKDRNLALRFAAEMPASRILHNCGGSTGSIGDGNGPRHSWTLGCGSWGRTSTTDNVGHENLLNIKRLMEGA